MVMTLDARRRFYAEEIEAAANLRTASLVDALAAVPRERFLPPGPWLVRSESDVQSAGRHTPDDDPRHVYHNLAVAIDAGRQLFNGVPGLLAMAIDRLALTPGAQVLHVGCATGYYAALMATCVGSTGRVVAVEVDPVLAAGARANLSATPWVTVCEGDGRGVAGPFDAVLINAGATHPLDEWLDAMSDGARMVVPITTSVSPTIGKGLMVLLTRRDHSHYDARAIGFVAIYGAVGIRDDALNLRIAQALKSNPFPPLARLRRDAHEPADTCWLHAAGSCLTLG